MSLLDRFGLKGKRLPKLDEAQLADLEKAGARADRDGAALWMTLTEGTIPKSWRGFEIKVGLGAYPPDAPGSHRKAIYAKLYPIEDLPRKLCLSQNSSFILGAVPLSAEGVATITNEPTGAEAEEAMLLAIGAAQRKAMQYLPPEVPA